MFEDSHKQKNTSSQSNGPTANDQAITRLLGDLIHLYGSGLVSFCLYLGKRPVTTLSVILISYFLIYFGVRSALHYEFLHSLAPEWITYKRLSYFNRYNAGYQTLVIFGLLSFPALMIMGFSGSLFGGRYEKIFKRIGLQNREGEIPSLVSKYTPGKPKITPKIIWKAAVFILELPVCLIENLYLIFTKKGHLAKLMGELNKALKILFRYFERPTKIILEFDGKSLSVEDFQKKKANLESSFKSSIETIREGKDASRIQVVLSKLKVPEHILLETLLKKTTLKEGSFIVGSSSEGSVVVSIQSLPHLSIGGTTGGGKSVLQKVIGLCLAISCPHLHLYVIDLKGGLEAVDFEYLPNVRIAKDMNEAIRLLRALKKEMLRRFAYLKEKRLKQIEPKRDRMDRIVVMIDEASVLTRKQDVNEEDRSNAQEARNLLDYLSKQARASAIHLILATQKVDRESIPTSIQENINGRVLFKANTLHGSINVLGNRDALDLPNHPGRGIWKVGNEQTIVQTPFVDDSTVESYCLNIADEFKTNKRSVFGKLIEPQDAPLTKTNDPIKSKETYRKNEE